MELAEKTPEFARRGLRVAVVTYDSPSILKHFAERRKIPYPMLSDEGSAVIRAFGILNTNIPADNPFHGVPFPGTYIVDGRGVVKSKYFEQDYRERFTAGAILLKEFATSGGGKRQEIRTRHLTLSLGSTNTAVYVGARLMLTLDVTLPARMHIYAPGVSRQYYPVLWNMAESKAWMALPPAYPQSRILDLKAIGEKVPVYEHRVRFTTDVVIGQNAEIKPEISPDNTMTLKGTFRYQACDDKVCYAPETVPLEWTFPVAPMDSQRVPVELRKGSKVGG